MRVSKAQGRGQQRRSAARGLVGPNGAAGVNNRRKPDGGARVNDTKMMGKGSKGGGGKGSGGNWPSKTGRPSGGGRGNSPPKK